MQYTIQDSSRANKTPPFEIPRDSHFVVKNPISELAVYNNFFSISQIFNNAIFWISPWAMIRRSIFNKF